MSEDEINEAFEAIVAADDTATLPQLVYSGPLNGPGTTEVLAFDCPVPDPDHNGYSFGRLFLVVPATADGSIVCYPAGLDDNNNRYAGRPHGQILGLSSDSADDALDNARQLHS